MSGCNVLRYSIAHMRISDRGTSTSSTTYAYKLLLLPKGPHDGLLSMKNAGAPGTRGVIPEISALYPGKISSVERSRCSLAGGRRSQAAAAVLPPAAAAAAPTPAAPVKATAAFLPLLPLARGPPRRPAGAQPRRSSGCCFVLLFVLGTGAPSSSAGASGTRPCCLRRAGKPGPLSYAAPAAWHEGGRRRRWRPALSARQLQQPLRHRALHACVFCSCRALLGLRRSCR
jgi:hypothetical protein